MASASKNDLLACGRLTIDLDAFANNWRLLRDKANEEGSTTECAACVKADAYGISIEKGVPALFEAGCRTFFVATPEEGIQTKALVGDAAKVYILNGLLPGCADLYNEHSLLPVLNTMEDVREWSEHSNGHAAALHVDTGMNRLGLREEEAKELAKDQALVEKLNLNLVMSHLACGDTPSSLMNGCQLSSFQEVSSLFPGVPRSLANSAGIFNGAAFHMDLVRPGIALYGGAALNAHANGNPMQPVVKAEARILQIRTVYEHESVGYGGAEVVDRDTKVATVSAGYADGYVRRAGSTTKQKGAKAFVNGQSVPLIGRVSMDLIELDVTDIDGIKRGDFVELFGPNASVTNVAGHAETIDYEFLTGLGKRYQRQYGPLGG